VRSISPPFSGLKKKPIKKYEVSLAQFDKDGGDIFFRNVGLFPNYTGIQPRILYCTQQQT
jgi:hypothetical protein